MWIRNNCNGQFRIVGSTPTGDTNLNYKVMNEQFTKQELDFIESCLNEVWYYCLIKLDSKDLGDIERRMITERQVGVKLLLQKIDKR